MPNQEAIREWVEALESGNYPQGQSVLVSTIDNEPVAYCCLGVACDLFADRFNLTTSPESISVQDVMRYTWHDGEGTVRSTTLLLPSPIVEFLGLPADVTSSQDIQVEVAGAHNSSLATMNDEGYTFAEIAAVIRANFLTDVDV